MATSGQPGSLLSGKAIELELGRRQPWVLPMFGAPGDDMYEMRMVSYVQLESAAPAYSGSIVL